MIQRKHKIPKKITASNKIKHKNCSKQFYSEDKQPTELERAINEHKEAETYTDLFSEKISAFEVMPLKTKYALETF